MRGISRTINSMDWVYLCYPMVVYTREPSLIVNLMEKDNISGRLEKFIQDNGKMG